MKLNFREGKADKIHILIDGEYKFTVDKTYFALMGLYQNMPVDEEELEEISLKISKRRTFNQAVSYLSRRDHSKKELIMKLRQKGFGEYAEEVVEKLEDDGYVDDERFAVLFVKELINVKKYGKRRVEQELCKKGISREIISSVLDEIEAEPDNLSEIIIKKYLRYLSDEKGIKRTVASLMRKGYSYSEIKTALEKVADEVEITDNEVSDE